MALREKHRSVQRCRDVETLAPDRGRWGVCVCVHARARVPGEGKDIWLGAEALPLFRDCPSESKYFIPLWNFLNLPPSPCRGRLGLWLPGRLCGKREKCEWRDTGKWENPGEDGVLLPWVPFRLQHSESLLHFDLRSDPPPPTAPSAS